MLVLGDAGVAALVQRALDVFDLEGAVGEAGLAAVDRQDATS